MLKASFFHLSPFTGLNMELCSAFSLFRQARHVFDVHNAAVRIVGALSTKHINSSSYVLMAACLADFEMLPTTFCGISVGVMLVVGMGADAADSALTRAGRHSSSVNYLKGCGCLLDSKKMRCFVSCQQPISAWMIFHQHEMTAEDSDGSMAVDAWYREHNQSRCPQLIEVLERKN